MLREYGIWSIDLDITDRCNFACSYCYHSKCTTDIDKDVQSKVIELIKKEDLTTTFFGGEPLMNFKGIQEVVSMAKPRQWSITSNLSLLDEKTEQFFLTNHGKIHCSIDGISCAHDKTRMFKNGQATLESILKNVPKALKIQPRDTVRMTVIPETAKYVYDSVVFLHQIGFKSVAPMIVLEADWDEKSFNDYDRALERLAEYNITNFELSIKPFYDVISKLCFFGGFNYHVCGAGFNTVAISTNGNISPCHRFSERESNQFSEYVFGNILKGGIDFDKIKKYRNFFFLNKIEKPECERCPHVIYCDRGCPNVSTLLFGVPNKVIPNQCRYIEIASKHAKWLLTQIANKQSIYFNRGGNCG